MRRVEKAVANKDLKPDERIRLVEAAKDEINAKKSRVAEIKSAQRRDAAAAASPRAPRTLAPVVVKSPRRPEHSPIRSLQPWNTNHAAASGKS